MTPQELRNSILQLAFQGRLVEQLSTECITPEPTNWSDASSFTEDNLPDIPESWRYARLADHSTILYGFPFNSERFNEDKLGKPIIRIRDINSGKTRTWSDELCDDRYRIVRGDMLVGMDGNFQVAFWDSEDAWLNQRVCKITANESMLDQRYLFYYLPIILKEVNDSVSYSTVKHLSAKILNSLIIPLPPLAEQKRIVAKIEELLPLIDRYEKAWSRLEDFNTRFPVDMQKSLLQLAIQGKLVEQRPEEGTGEELYEQIQAEKQKLIKEGKIKKEKPLPEVIEEDTPFEISESWKWIRLSNIASLCLGKMLDRQKNKGTNCLYLRNVNVRWGTFELEDLLEMKFEDENDPRFLVSDGDLVMCEGGEPGRCAVWKENYSIHFQKALHRIRFYGHILPDFYYYVIQLYSNNGVLSPLFTGTTIKHLTGQVLDKLVIPLPPFVEQKRIVAKLEELLPLCDQLK